jgi:Prp8 binding protein
MVLKGHRNAVVDLSWSGDGTHIVSASPDKTVRAWDAITGKQVHISPSQVFWWFDAV